MGIERAIHDQLVGNDTGTLVGTRVYITGNNADPAVLPYVTIQRIGSEHPRHLGGKANIIQVRVQINAWAETNKDAEITIEAVRTDLEDFRGTMGVSPDDFAVRICLPVDSAAEFVQPSDGSERGRHTLRMDFEIWYLDS